MPTEFETVIGLEIHVQINTKTKLFCSCPASGPEGKPNVAICPVCTGQPGVLPVLNKAAVETAIKAALSVDCRINERSVFARKNYFYPDLPKGYQISQYELPLAEHGKVDIGGKTVRIKRIHIEEDAGKLMHALGSQELSYSLADYNRSSMPLIEIVSEPDMSSPEDAYEYLTSLKNIMQWTGVSNCDMEKGELRVDVNISVRPKGEEKLGTKVEIKNLNSFKAVKDALNYEADRQVKAVLSGEKIVQETRLWNEKSAQTVSMRSKEEAHDYRYFPDPDLVPVSPEPEWIEKIKSAIPELPNQRKERFISTYGLNNYDARILTSSKDLSTYFEATATAYSISPNKKPVANWITTDLLGRLNAEKKSITESPITAEFLAGLTSSVERGVISGRMGKEVFDAMWKTGKSAKEIIESSGMSQVSDKGQLETWAKEAIAENAKAADDVRSGNEKAIGALVGAVMKKSKGKANPAALNALLKELLR